MLVYDGYEAATHFYFARIKQLTELGVWLKVLQEATKSITLKKHPKCLQNMYR